MEAKKPKKMMKPGTVIEFRRRARGPGGEVVRGKVVGTDDKVNGRWIAVNTAPPRQNPHVVYIRESQVVRVVPKGE